jgi:hypothetical protein
MLHAFTEKDLKEDERGNDPVKKDLCAAIASRALGRHCILKNNKF